MLTYVGDLISMTNSEYLRTWWKAELSKRFKVVAFKVKCEGILNMKIDRGKHPKIAYAFSMIAHNARRRRPNVLWVLVVVVLLLLLLQTT